MCTGWLSHIEPTASLAVCIIEHRSPSQNVWITSDMRSNAHNILIIPWISLNHLLQLMLFSTKPSASNSKKWKWGFPLWICKFGRRWIQLHQRKKTQLKTRRLSVNNALILYFLFHRLNRERFSFMISFFFSYVSVNAKVVKTKVWNKKLM